MDLIKRAQVFAHKAHNSIGQKRKYSGEPYWVHTDAVAAKVASIGGTPEMVAAAHLHDVLEDVTPCDKSGKYNYDTIVAEFGQTVADFVVQLTDVYTKAAYPKLNRAARHDLERERLAKISVEAKTIKLADLHDNTASIVANDKDFAKVYLREKLELLPYISEGHPELLQQCAVQVIAACAEAGVHIPVLSA